VKFLVFEKYRQEVGDQYIVGLPQPKSWRVPTVAALMMTVLRHANLGNVRTCENVNSVSRPIFFCASLYMLVRNVCTGWSRKRLHKV